MAEICLIPPAGECIHIDEARNDRRIDDHADDAKIRSLIVAARQAAESKTRQQFLHARWKLVLNGFPYVMRLPHSPLVDVVSIEYMDMASAWQTMPPADYAVNDAMTPAIITPVFGRVWPIPLPQIGTVRVTYNAGYASPFITGGTLSATQIRVTGPVVWAVGARVQFYNSGGVLPAPLDADQSYLVATATSGVYTLTDAAGSTVTFTQPGTGRNFIGVVPDGIRSWMLLRVGSLFENREEVSIGQRLTMVEPAFVDGLLAPFMTDLA
ncbi:MAG: hypothetical protein JWQ01_4884 [Massilia sp.]|nr:hypothetical protein [Massilia sp.]